MPEGADGAADTAKASPAPADDDMSEEVYIGVVKSYNDRRGFGFLACAETAMRYGRDVYMPKAEAAQAALDAARAEGDEAALAAAAAAAEAAARAAAAKAAAAESGIAPAQPIEKPPPAPRLAEEDLVRFRVRLSVEGFPQAACCKKMRKFTGVVSRVPSEIGAETDVAGAIVCEAASELLGLKEVPLGRPACAQLRISVGDEVTFCVPEPADLLPDCAEENRQPADPSQLEAKTLFLSKTSRGNGSVLGCFTLDLPRTGAARPEGAPPSPNLHLHCHAFGDKLILAGLPADLEEAELMRFFSKQGATGTIVAHARACSFASVSFPSIVEVARFLGRTAHALSDDKETLMAQLLPLAPSADTALLPALPAPSLALGEEAGALLVVWSPLVLAVAYAVELRPAGANGPWATVEVASNSLGNGANRFDSNCSSCKVAGLNVGVAYEARVSYFTECGTRSEASEPSQPCIAVQTPVATGLGIAEGFGAGGLGMVPGAAELAAASQFQGLPPVPSWSPDGMPGLPTGLEGYPPALPSYLPSAGWRSATGMVVPPPAQPELRPADEYGFAVSVQWPAVLQAAAYVVELREAGSAAFERFVRSAPEAKLGTLVELRVGGLRPGPPPGRVYVAQVRTVAVDGSESAPSPPGVSPPLPAQSSTTAGASAAADSRSTGSVLSADAPAWQPSGALAQMAADPLAAAMTLPAVGPTLQPPPISMGGWAPPPWLGQLQPDGTALGTLTAEASVASGAAYAPGGPMAAPPPGAPPPPTAPAPAAPAPGISPAPPSAPPEVRPGEILSSGPPPPAEPAPEVTGQEDCLILD